MTTYHNCSNTSRIENIYASGTNSDITTQEYHQYKTDASLEYQEFISIDTATTDV